MVSGITRRSRSAWRIVTKCRCDANLAFATKDTLGGGMDKYVQPSAVPSHVARERNDAQMLWDLLCAT